MRVLVTGGHGMLGSSLLRRAAALRPNDEFIGLSRTDVDLRDAAAVAKHFGGLRPDAILHTAARVGGIAANIAAPANFIFENLQIDAAVLGAARAAGVNRFVYFGSSCMYPKDYRQPLVEDDILAGPLEPTNEGYALAKIAGAKTSVSFAEQYDVAYRVVIPSNLYGPGDHYEPERSHLVAAALAKVHQFKTGKINRIEVWGDGTARREFTFVDDVADWITSNLDSLSNWPHMLNLGFGADHSVAEYYRAAMRAAQIDAELTFDVSKPIGMKQKLMDSSIAREMGWNPPTDLDVGMDRAYGDFLEWTHAREQK